MKITKFRHLSSFGFSGTEIPTKKLKSFFAKKLQAELLGGILRNEEGKGPGLTELKEPNKDKINYEEKTRGLIQQIWEPLIENPSAIPSTQLLDRANSAWNLSQKRIVTAQENAIGSFNERGKAKDKVIRDEAIIIASEKGIPFALRWLKTLKNECEIARKAVQDEFNGYIKRKQRQKHNLEALKEEWIEVLGKHVDYDGHNVARKFLFLAGAILLLGLGLWYFNINVNSIAGIAGTCIVTLIGLKFVLPIFRHLSLSRNVKHKSNKILSAYKAISLFELDEGLKKLEMAYFGTTLRSLINDIHDEYEARSADLERKIEELNKNIYELKDKLLESPPTIRPLIREESLKERYEFGYKTAQITNWKRKIVSLEKDFPWKELEMEAEGVYSFVEEVKAETELYLTYPDKDERMQFLKNLKDAAVGCSMGEAFLSLDFAATGSSPEVYLMVEIFEPENSKLAKEITNAWGDTGMGLSIIPGSNPAEITLVGLIYGFPLEAIKEWEDVEDSFNKIYSTEGEAIYPFLVPEHEGEE